MSDDVIPIFPPTISFGDLKATHAEYDLKKIQKHSDLYEGGDAFRSRIDRYLLKLQDEMFSEDELKAMYFASFNPKAESHGAPGEWDNKLQKEWNGARAGIGKQWSARKARAWYVPIVAGLVDFMIAAIFQNPPALVPGDVEPMARDKKADDSEDVLIGEVISTDLPATPQDFWHQFNLDVDGNGTSLRELLRNALLELMLNKRAYIATAYPGGLGEFSEVKKAGGFDAKLFLLKACDVDDWCEGDERNELKWIRVHRHTLERSEPWLQPDTECHYWTYITENAMYEYELRYPKDKPPPDGTMVGNYDEETDAPTDCVISEYETGFPVVQIPCDVWVMERLADPALGLFNRQASLTWHLDKAAFALLVLYTKRALQTVVDSTIGAVRLDPTDKCEFASPSMEIPGQLFKDIDRFKDELHAAVQAMVLQAASKDTGDRASGVAKQRDFGALSTLLTPFAMALKESLATVVRKVIKVRKDEVSMIIQGLDKYDVQSVEMKLANVMTYLGIVGERTETGTKSVLADATLAMMPNASSKLREKAVSEIQSSKPPEKPEPVPAPGGTAFKPAPLNSGKPPVNQPPKGVAAE